MRKRLVNVIMLMMVLTAVLFSGIAGCSGNKTDVGNNNPENEKNSETEIKEESTAKQSEAEWEIGEGKVVTWVNSIGTVWAQVIIPVSNTGTEDLYLGSGTVDLEDAEGHLVENLTMVPVYPQIIKPGETAYYYEETTLETEEAIELNAVIHADVSKSKNECIRYEVSDISLNEGSFGGVSVTGRVENTSDEPGEMVYVVVFLYNADGELIGQVFNILTDELVPGDKIGFSANTLSAPDYVIPENIDHVDAIAYPMQIQF